MRAGTTLDVTVHGRLPGRLEELRYYRTSDSPGYYKHAFTTPTDLFALTDGGLLIRPKTPRGGLMAAKLWLDNPRGHHKKHHRHHHRHNPFLAAYNPGALVLLKHYASVPYVTATVSGAAGFGATYLGYKALFSLTMLGQYGVDPSYTGIAIRLGGRVAMGAAGDFLLSRFFSGHNRLAYIGGSAAYIGLATVLEVLGYKIELGAPAGAPLVSILPAALQPAASVAGMDGFIRRGVRPRGVAGDGIGAFVSQRTLGLHPSRMFQNRLSPA